MKRILIFAGALLAIYIILTIAINIPSKNITQSKTSFNTPLPTGTVTPAANLKSEDVKVGDGEIAKAGQLVTVNYIGTLTDGKKFESSYDNNQPYTFTLGAGEVISGWDQGIVGMKVGGKRRLTIPPELAYGANGQGAIPANATLIFEVELISVKDQESTQPNLNL